MNASSPRERIRRRAEEAAARYGRAQAEDERRGGEPPQPGDLYVFAETADLQWAALERDPADGRRLLAVPADVHPHLGSADVAVPADSASGAMSLRCRFGVWLDVDDFDRERRTGSLEPEVLERARRKRAALDGDRPVGSSAERDTDREPEYQDLEKELVEAQAALRERRRQREQEPVGKVVPFRRPGARWGSVSSPYAMAASILLVVALGMAAGMLAQLRKIGDLEQERASAEQARGQEQQERQRVEESHRRLQEESRQAERKYQHRITELEQRAQGAGRDEPLVNLPFAWLSPQEDVRGPLKTITVSRAASYFVLILAVSDPEPYPGYRLEIREVDAEGPVFSGAVAMAGIAEVSVALPRRLVGAGEYQLHLYGLRGGKAELVEEYGLSVEVE